MYLSTQGKYFNAGRNLEQDSQCTLVSTKIHRPAS